MAELDDMHGQIVTAVDKAAAHWRRFPPERGKHGPDIPPWQAPRTLAEARERERRAKSELETLKLRIRGGVLVADAEIRHGGADIVIKWREACLERPALLVTRMVLSEFGLAVTADQQWPVFTAINRCARDMLTEIRCVCGAARDR